MVGVRLQDVPDVEYQVVTRRTKREPANILVRMIMSASTDR
jgi:hypothetical protein